MPVVILCQLSLHFRSIVSIKKPKHFSNWMVVQFSYVKVSYFGLFRSSTCLYFGVLDIKDLTDVLKLNDKYGKLLYVLNPEQKLDRRFYLRIRILKL